MQQFASISVAKRAEVYILLHRVNMVKMDVNVCILSQYPPNANAYDLGNSQCNVYTSTKCVLYILVQAQGHASVQSLFQYIQNNMKQLNHAKWKECIKQPSNETVIATCTNFSNVHNLVYSL